jgi:hypothetical protein
MGSSGDASIRSITVEGWLRGVDGKNRYGRGDTVRKVGKEMAPDRAAKLSPGPSTNRKDNDPHIDHSTPRS